MYQKSVIGLIKFVKMRILRLLFLGFGSDISKTASHDQQTGQPTNHERECPRLRNRSIIIRDRSRTCQISTSAGKERPTAKDLARSGCSEGETACTDVRSQIQAGCRRQVCRRRSAADELQASPVRNYLTVGAANVQLSEP